MTLKEKFRHYLTGHLSDEKTEVDAKIATDIANEFAIGFAYWIRACILKGRPYDFDNIQLLLLIYKEEQGL